MNPQSVHRRALRALAPCLLAGFFLASAAHALAAPPSIQREWLDSVSARDATLSVEIDPEGLETEYQFHLVGFLTCPPPTPEKATCNVIGRIENHLPPGSIPAGNEPVTVSLTVSEVGQELLPETEYEFDAEATNKDGSTQGVTYRFKTRPAGPPPEPPVNSVAPAVLGTPEPGEDLFCHGGAWGNNPTGYDYVWLRDGSAVSSGDVRIVPGSNGRELEVQAEDRGHEISCEVTAGNRGGSTSALSNVVQVPELPLAPASVDPPVLAGSPEPGATLACSQGTWENDPTDYEYAWLRDGSLLASGHSSDLLVSAADRGHALACAVTASNDGGAAQATSNSIAVPAAETQPQTQPQPSAELPPVTSVLPTAPLAPQAIPLRRCRRAGHARSARARVAAGRSCHSKHKKVR